MLGDYVHNALAGVGVTPEAVYRWVGSPCGCEERRAKLNALDLWARRAARVTLTVARDYLILIMQDGVPEMGKRDPNRPDPTDVTTAPTSASRPRELVVHNRCRICGSSDLEEIINLGDQTISGFPELPPGDALLASHGSNLPTAPVILDFCRGCTLVQQRVTVPQDGLYQYHYWYRSGVTDTMKSALKDVADSVCRRVVLSPGDVVLDIGSNDGTLLHYFPQNVVRVGVEPARNMVGYYEGTDLILINEFWGARAYADCPLVPRERYRGGVRKAKIITACGMFYDLERPGQFIHDVANCLDPKGVFVAQLMCLRNMVDANDLGNLCHEHLEFYSLQSLKNLYARAGLEIFDLETNGVNGGSYRVYARHAAGACLGNWVDLCLTGERAMGLNNPSSLRRWAEALLANLARCADFVRSKEVQDAGVWAYGASTKGNLLLQVMGLTSDFVTSAADRSPEKWGRYTTTGIYIQNEESFRKASPGYALVLPYAFLQEFVEREADWRRAGGKFIVPLPEFRVV